MRASNVRRVEFRRDRQFLPAALEVLETPSSPTRRALLLTLCTFVVLALGWSLVGHIDIEAVAKGKVQPSRQGDRATRARPGVGHPGRRRGRGEGR